MYDLSDLEHKWVQLLWDEYPIVTVKLKSLDKRQFAILPAIVELNVIEYKGESYEQVKENKRHMEFRLRSAMPMRRDKTTIFGRTQGWTEKEIVSNDPYYDNGACKMHSWRGSVLMELPGEFAEDLMKFREIGYNHRRDGTLIPVMPTVMYTGPRVEIMPVSTEREIYPKWEMPRWEYIDKNRKAETRDSMLNIMRQVQYSEGTMICEEDYELGAKWQLPFYDARTKTVLHGVLPVERMSSGNRIKFKVDSVVQLK